jgi:hypothetical protein
VVETLGLVEHVLAEHAFVHARGGDRRHVLEHACLDGIGERHRVPRAVDVGDDLAVGVRLQVVDGGEVEEVLDLSRELLLVGLRYAAQRLAEVAEDRNRAVLADLLVFEQRRDLVPALRAYEEVNDGAPPGQQFLDEAPADESRGAGDKVGHREVSWTGSSGSSTALEEV